MRTPTFLSGSEENMTKKGEIMKAHQEFEINYYQDEDGIFTAVVPAIRGCVASGKTLKEAYRNAVDAIGSCLEARAKLAARKPRKRRYNGVNIYRRQAHA